VFLITIIFFFFQVGYSNTSPLLSQDSRFPLYSRTSPSETLNNYALVTLLKKFNWKRVAILVQQDHIFTKVNLIFNFFSLEKVVLAIERLDFNFSNSLINKGNPDRDVTVFGHPSLQFSFIFV